MGLLFVVTRNKDLGCANGSPLRQRRKDCRIPQQSQQGKRVLYPGLDTHPTFPIAEKQMERYGGMISFTVNGGEKEARGIAQGTKIFTLAESLGAVESLIEIPAAMTHLSTEGSPLEVDKSLIRLSVGIETVNDLISDLDQAMS